MNDAPSFDADTTHTAEVRRDLAYGADPKHAFDLYLPASRGPVPLVVWVHGGAWMVGDKANQIEHKVALWNASGWGVASVNYRLSPNPPSSDPSRVMFPAHPDDVGAAIRWIVAHAGELRVDASRIALLGHSAGAHLAALVALDDRYSATVKCVGSFDTESYDIPRARASASAQQLAILENAIGDGSNDVAASPITYADASAPPFLIAVRGGDERKGMQRDFANALPRSTEIDATGLSHEEVNELIGVDTRMTPPIQAFLTDCLR